MLQQPQQQQHMYLMINKIKYFTKENAVNSATNAAAQNTPKIKPIQILPAQSQQPQFLVGLARLRSSKVHMNTDGKNKIICKMRNKGIPKINKTKFKAG